MRTRYLGSIGIPHYRPESIQCGTRCTGQGTRSLRLEVFSSEGSPVYHVPYTLDPVVSALRPLACALQPSDHPHCGLTKPIDRTRSLGHYDGTMILSINPENPQKRLITRVCEVLERGGLIAYPPDTFYGIGCQ